MNFQFTGKPEAATLLDYVHEHNGSVKIAQAKRDLGKEFYIRGFKDLAPYGVTNTEKGVIYLRKKFFGPSFRFPVWLNDWPAWYQHVLLYGFPILCKYYFGVLVYSVQLAALIEANGLHIEHPETVLNILLEHFAEHTYEPTT